jgi:hypothetical protein
MFLSDGCGNPDDSGSVKAASVREQLTKVTVVGRLQLVLDDQSTAVGNVIPDEVDGIPADRDFSFVDHEIQAERLAKKTDVRSEPWSEVKRFVGPHLSGLNALQLTQRHLGATFLNDHSLFSIAVPNRKLSSRAL